MSSLSSPWSGLSALAPRMDLAGVVRALLAVPEAARVDIEQLRAAGLRPAEALRVAGTGPWSSARASVCFLHAGEPSWPASLAGLPRGPVALALEGEAGLLGRPCVAVVGSRACTPYGREQAGRLAAGLAAAGVVVVSGLAAGIDLAAHAGAGGSTIAVLGQGLDAPMPGWQRRARDALLARGGLVVSELPPTTHADAFTFPVRNRIIAGLARVVVVVEARERSGARNTASHAQRYGRPVLAVPGPLDAPASVGCLDLLEQGARMVRGVHTVLDAAGLPAGAAPVHEDVRGGEDDALLRHLRAPSTPEALMEATGWPWATVSERLGVLELTGRVVRLPGRRYQVRSR